MSLAPVPSGHPPAADGSTRADIRLPLSFVPNRGQVRPAVDFVVPGSGTTMAFDGRGVTIAVRTSGNRGGRWAVRMGFDGADPNAHPAGVGPASTTFSWFRGPPEAWVTGVHSFDGVVYRDLWPGIALGFGGRSGSLKYRLTVAPGADPNAIGFATEGSTGLDVASDGSLRIGTGLGALIDRPPTAYQRVGRAVMPVAVSYRLRDDDAYGFRLGEYDRRRPIVIDPELAYAGYLGGSGFQDWGTDIAVDANGAAYVSGRTESTEATFPETVGPDLTYNGGFTDAFVAKVAPSGRRLLYAGYIGGSGREEARGIAVDATGAAYVTGWTNSRGGTFPATVGDRSFSGGFADAFVAKVDPSGTALQYGRYLGGDGDDFGYDIAVDPHGAAYVTGSTKSRAATFPVRIGPDLTYNGGFSDSFVAKVMPSGRSLAYAGYIGGSFDDEEGDAIAVDATGAAYVTGMTHSDESSFPVLVGPALTYGGFGDAYVAKVDPSGTSLVYAGYIGGNEFDSGSGIAVDSTGAAYVTGDAGSQEDTFPVTTGPDLTYNGDGDFFDAFVGKIAPDGGSFVYLGYIGGARTDFGSAVAVGTNGAAYVAGETSSNGFTFPAGGGPDRTFNGIHDAFVARVRPGGTSLAWATYLGGSAEDSAYGVALDQENSVYVTGLTKSNADTFPVTVGPDRSLGGGIDAFVAKLVAT